MKAIAAKQPIGKAGTEKGEGSSNLFAALAMLADEQEAGLPNETVKKLAQGIVRAETWISTWPEMGGPRVEEADSVDSHSQFDYSAQFRVVNGSSSGPLFINAKEYRPKAKSSSSTDPQRWIETASNSYTTPRQKDAINSNKFYSGDRKELPVAMSIFRFNQKTHSFMDANGRIITDNQKNPRVSPRTKYIVFGRGKIGDHTSPPGSNEVLLPDVFYLELSTDESAQAFLEFIKPESKLSPQLLIASISHGISRQPYLDAIREGRIEETERFMNPNNKNNPVGNRIKFYGYNGSGLK